MFKVTNSSKVKYRFGRTLILAASVLSMLLLAGCISSSRVYNNDKTIVYKGSMYNMANVKQINTVITGVKDGDREIDLKNTDKKQFNAILDQEKSLYVKMAFQFDDQEMLYRANTVKSWNEFSKMKSSFKSAGDKISKLMSNKKQLQLKLK
jgi:outer membrane murein-binding lipoprotein Lpp